MTLDDIVDFYGKTFIADVFKEQGKVEGLEQGIEQGSEQGIGRGKAEGLRTLLVERFGERPEADDVVRRLVAGDDLPAAFRAVLKAEAFEDLLA